MNDQYLSRNWNSLIAVSPLQLSLAVLLFFSLHSVSIANNIVNGGVIGSNQTTCWGTAPDLIQNITLPSGGDANLEIEYIWLKAVPGSSFPGPAWQEVPNSNTPNFQAGALNESTAYIRCSRRVGFTDYTGESNTVEITVLPAPNLGADLPASTFVDAAIEVEAGFNPFASYSWDFGTDASPATASGRTVSSVSWSIAGTKAVTLTVVDQYNCTHVATYSIDVLNNPLPVEMVYFRGLAERGRLVHLAWETESEENNRHFEIQHSLDGRHFSTIGMQLGSGTTEVRQRYTYVDQFPSLGTNYYRLKQVDLNGDYAFSDILALEITQAWEAVAVAYPNPFVDQFQIQLIEESIDDLRVEVIDARGVLLSRTIWESGQKQQVVDLSNYPAGLYHVSLHTRQRPIFSRTVMKSMP